MNKMSPVDFPCHNVNTENNYCNTFAKQFFNIRLLILVRTAAIGRRSYFSRFLSDFAMSHKIFPMVAVATRDWTNNMYMVSIGNVDVNCMAKMDPDPKMAVSIILNLFSMW